MIAYYTFLRYIATVFVLSLTVNRFDLWIFRMWIFDCVRVRAGVYFIVLLVCGRINFFF